MAEDLPLVSKLSDGRLLWLAEDNPKVLEDGSWVVPDELTFGAAFESKPLADSEIRDLVSKGMFSQ